MAAFDPPSNWASMSVEDRQKFIQEYHAAAMGNSDGFSRASPQLGSPEKNEAMNNSWFQPAPSEVTTFSPQVLVGSFMESKFEFTNEGRALNSRLLKVRHEI